MKPEIIILHHSLTEDGVVVDWDAIRKYHINHNGWKDIGYHFGVEKIGDHYETMVGRPWNQVGAHTHGYNDISLGICLVGNFDNEPPPQAQWDEAVKLVSALIKTFNIFPADIYGHRDFSLKTCPGNAFDLQRFKVDVNNYKGE